MTDTPDDGSRNPSGAPDPSASGAPEDPWSAVPEVPAPSASGGDRRRRRRLRDRRAEASAVKWVTAATLILAAGALVWVQRSVPDPAVPALRGKAQADDAQPRSKAPPASTDWVATPAPPVPPAIEMVRREGLTVAAPGIPEVNLGAGAAPSAGAAGRETCRFAYGVWEFSPNRRFRFLTTCPALAGAVWVGAYEVAGEMLRLSVLQDGQDGRVRWQTDLRLSNPAQAKTTVMLGRAKEAVLDVSQRVAVIRAGLHGSAFVAQYRRENDLQVASPPRRSGRRRR